MQKLEKFGNFDFFKFFIAVVGFFPPLEPQLLGALRLAAWWRSSCSRLGVGSLPRTATS